MTTAEMEKLMLETKIELETLRTMLIQRGKLNSMEYETLKKKISEEFQKERPAMF